MSIQQDVSEDQKKNINSTLTKQNIFKEGKGVDVDSRKPIFEQIRLPPVGQEFRERYIPVNLFKISLYESSKYSINQISIFSFIAAFII